MTEFYLTVFALNIVAVGILLRNNGNIILIVKRTSVVRISRERVVLGSRSLNRSAVRTFMI